MVTGRCRQRICDGRDPAVERVKHKQGDESAGDAEDEQDQEMEGPRERQVGRLLTLHARCLWCGTLSAQFDPGDSDAQRAAVTRRRHVSLAQQRDFQRGRRQ